MVATYLSVGAGPDSGRLRAGQVLAPLGLSATASGDVPPGTMLTYGSHNGQPVTSWPLGAMPGTGGTIPPRQLMPAALDELS